MAGCSTRTDLDLAQLDAEAADLDLAVEAAEEIKLAVLAQAHVIIGSIEAPALDVLERSRMNALVE